MFMKLFSWLAWLLSLGVALVAWALSRLEPALAVGTPWGRVTVAELFVVGVLLGVAVMGLLFVGTWWSFNQAGRRRLRELRQAQSELRDIKTGKPPQEIPIIPDRMDMPD